MPAPPPGASSSDPTGAEKILDEAKQDLHRLRLKMKTDDVGAHLDDKRMNILAETDLGQAENRKKCKDILEKALGVDLDAAMKVEARDRKRSMAMMVFFGVLTGLELDLLGFIASFQVYWNLKTVACPHYGLEEGDFNMSAYMELQNLSKVEAEEQMGHCSIGVLRILLTAMPVAYTFTVLAYMFLLDPDPSTHPTADVGDVFKEDNRTSPQTASLVEDELGDMLAKPKRGTKEQVRARTEPKPEDQADQADFRAKAIAMRVRIPVKLTWFHFTPLLRFMLIIKQIDENDIEGVFRVNALSSFTLGTAQIMGLLFSFSNFDGDFASLSLFVYVNIFSQLVNWLITIAYYATSVSRTMSNVIIVDSYKTNVVANIKEELLLLHKEVDEDARAAAQAGNQMKQRKGRAEKRLRKVEWEIKKMKNLTVKLDCFLPKDILGIRRVLLQHWGDEFAKC